ncbi:hypothetical protein BJ166DRAFT_629431 [Pestalotiopsis sp. NC0098]|nr:hypothetical protein BJ166DRAFT_629431 [Pestalotiopsis sp. NC0098]
MTASSTTTVARHDGRNPSLSHGASSVLNAKLNSEAQPVISVSKLDVATLPCDRVLTLNLALSHTALSTITVPILAYRSRVPGPTVGIVAAIHGNEINGVPVIQKLFNDIRTCAKTVAHGKKTGTSTQQYAYQVFHEIILKFDYLVDLHTASRGRKNSLYVRADMNQPTIKEMAQLLQPQIIVHNSSPGGSIRGCAQSAGINAVTVEIGDCSVFQSDLIEATNVGISNILRNIGLLGSEDRIIPTCKTVECERSYWVFSSQPGILRVYKNLAERLERGSLIAEVQTIFGQTIEAIHAPSDYDTVVVGLENNPVAKRGNRVVHLGVVGTDFPRAPVDDGHF